MVLGDAPPPARSPKNDTQGLPCSAVAEDDVIETMGETTDCMDPPPTISHLRRGFAITKDPPPPPGWVPDSPGGQPVVVPLSPIAPDSADDSVTATMGSSRDESIFPSEVGVIVPPVGDVRSGPTADELRAVSPLLQDLLWAPVAPRSPDIADRRAPCSADQVPRWRLARLARTLFVHLVLDVRFGIPPIGHQTTLRYRGSSVFPCIIRDSSNGLVFHIRLAF